MAAAAARVRADQAVAAARRGQEAGQTLAAARLVRQAAAVVLPRLSVILTMRLEAVGNLVKGGSDSQILIQILTKIPVLGRVTTRNPKILLTKS